MEKLVKIIFFMSIMVGCSTVKNQVDTKVSDLEVSRYLFSRGRIENQIVNHRQTIIVTSKDSIIKETNSADWKKIEKLVNQISLNNLENIPVESTSKAHQYDGAAGVSLQINQGKQTYYSPLYDEGRAPKEIHELDEFLASFSK